MRLRHLEDDFVESYHGVAHLVVLGGDIGQVRVGFAQEVRFEIHSPGAVGQRAAFAHFLEANGVHTAAEVLVVEGIHGHGGGVESAAEVSPEAHVDLVGIVGRYEHHGLVGGAVLEGSLSGAVGIAIGGEVDGIEHINHVLGRLVAVIEGGLLHA